MADELGLGGPMGRFPFELSPVSDALTYADQTVGPYGRRLSLDERLADMLRRHGPASANARAHARRAPYLGAAAARVEARLLAATSGKLSSKTRF